MFTVWKFRAEVKLNSVWASTGDNDKKNRSERFWSFRSLFYAIHQILNYDCLGRLVPDSSIELYRKRQEDFEFLISLGSCVRKNGSLQPNCTENVNFKNQDLKKGSS